MGNKLIFMKQVTGKNIIQNIIELNYCSGCGIWTVSGQFKIALIKYGQYLPQTASQDFETAEVVCPFANHGINENDIYKEHFDEAKTRYHPDFGDFKNLYAGYVNEGDYPQSGSWGGTVSWLTKQLLKENLVNYIVQKYKRLSLEISEKVKEQQKLVKQNFDTLTQIK
ncbi:MAG TPA: hypothetical protein ENK67_05100 [Flavobacteriia bacterium]|nr:hypothetical protein [Flavobacteriia bacterium]